MQSVRQRAERILIADDDVGVTRIISDHLRHAGYQVLTAGDGEAAVALARDGRPDLALIGLMLPDGSGLETCRALASLPAPPAVFLLAALVDRETRLAALAAGVEEVITKPFDPVDLVARIAAYLSAGSRGEPRHPLTGLPFRSALDSAMQVRLERRDAFRLLLIDLNGLRGYNASYGLVRGDEAIRRLADIVREAVSLAGAPGDLIGHAAEDDLAVITTAPATPLCSRITALFDAVVGDLYDEEDRRRGYSLSLDRQGQPHQHPLLRVSIGVVESEIYLGAHPVELWQAATEVLTYARALPGSAFHIDQRRSRSRGGSPGLMSARDVRAARAHGLARAVDAGVLGLASANLRAGLAELAGLSGLPVASGPVLERLQTHLAVVQAHIQAAQGWRGFTPAPLEFAAILDEALRSARHVAAGRGVELATAGPAPATPMVADGEKLVAGLRSLLHGMVDFTRAGGRIWLQASSERGRVLLRLTTDRPAGDRAALLASLRTPAVGTEAAPLAGLALGRGLLAILGATVEPGPVAADEATVQVVLPANWHSALDGVNTLEGALDDLHAAARASLRALEDGLTRLPGDSDEEAAGAALDELRAHLAALQANLKRLIVTANQLALLADEAAIECARATEAEIQAEADYLTTVEALVEALEARVPSRLGHGRRVAGLAVALGRRLRLSQAELTTLYRAGLLADVGLVTVEAELLNRPGELSAAERLAIQGHPAASLRLLRGAALLADARPAIASHHERYDGAGYPEGLAGPAIPLAGRILAVADAVVAMLSPRPYRAALTPAAVEATLVAGAGSQFDPTVVDAARALAAEGSLARLAGAPLAGVAR